jgi:hypothetical protein
MKISDIKRKLIERITTTTNDIEVCRAYEVIFGKTVVGAERGQFNEKTGVVDVLG